MLCFEVLVLAWIRNELKTTGFLKVRVYTVLGGNLTHDFCLSLDLNLYYLGWGSNSGLLIFLSLGFILFWTRNELKTTDFLKVRVYTVLGGNLTHDFCLF